MTTQAVNWGDPRLPERFWDKVVPEPNSGCWFWTGESNKGHGSYLARALGKKGPKPKGGPPPLWPKNRRGRVIAKRHAYEVLVRPVSKVQRVTSTCAETSCCNPAHAKVVRANARIVANRSRRPVTIISTGPTRRRWLNVWNKYGLTRDDVKQKLDEQSRGCAICLFRFESVEDPEINIDHCHATGDNRGLLCTGCNFAIGAMRDRPSLLRAAEVYLIKHGTPEDD